jgi:ribose transport system permease protein
MMSETIEPVADPEIAEPAGEASQAGSGSRRSLSSLLSVRNIGAVYVWIAIIVLFALLSPEQFPTGQTAKSILNQYAVTGVVALSLVVPLAAGYYDLSIGYTVSLSGVVVAWLLNHGFGPVEAGVVTILGCVVIGLFNAFVVDGLKVDSFIGTLATGAILGSLTIAITNDQPIIGNVGNGFARLSTTNIDGFTLPVLYMLALMVVLAYWLERTQSGRYMYATGYDRETARLTGIRIHRVTVTSFICSAVLSGFAGMVLAARISAGSPEAGPGYLIPAFSAAFLGATQFRGGRFNPWGTVIAVLLLGTGDVGLLISGGPIWTPQLFEGAVLIAAVSLTGPGREAVGTRLRLIRGRRVGDATLTPTITEGDPDG